MLNQTTYNIKLPDPVDCDCGKGKLLPIFHPVQLTFRSMAGPPTDCVREGINEVIWQCSSCYKIVRGIK